MGWKRLIINTITQTRKETNSITRERNISTTTYDKQQLIQGKHVLDSNSYLSHQSQESCTKSTGPLVQTQFYCT